MLTSVLMAVIVCVRARALHLGDLLWSAAWVAALALLKGLEIAGVHRLLAVLRESPRAREPWSCVILVW